MLVRFNIRYRAQWGEQICILGHAGEIVRWTEENPLVLQCSGQEYWSLEKELSDGAGSLDYRYALRRADGRWLYEAGAERQLELEPAARCYTLSDWWRQPSDKQVFHTKAFTQALFARRTSEAGLAAGLNGKGYEGTGAEGSDETALCPVEFHLDCPQVEPSMGVALMGNADCLGAWDSARMVPMDDSRYPQWTARIYVPAQSLPLQYKYVLYRLDTHEIYDLETGDDRRLESLPRDGRLVVNDFDFRPSRPRWRGAGVAIPVFSLRSRESFGIGEFQDLKKLARWAAQTGQRLIQTLPVNDTTLQHNRRDSYPYNAVSVFALNPIFLNIEQMGQLSPAKLRQYQSRQAELNALPIADYAQVAQAKAEYFKYLYRKDKDALFASEDYQKFYQANRRWLAPYAVFCYLRDRFGTADFLRWGKYSVYRPADQERMIRPDFRDYDKVAIHFYLQYHLDRQLRDAAAECHRLGVALKGDIPIGISPDSVDAWTNPELFNQDGSAGAPPDDFSLSGQNWGFPTYNWDTMARDGFDWWRRRFTKMADYFDAYRIDHILGFFRIWEIDRRDVWGLCGRFSPALPYSRQELQAMGLGQWVDSWTKPCVRESYLPAIFGSDAQWIKDTFLQTADGDTYTFRPEFDTQRKVKDWFKAHADEIPGPADSDGLRSKTLCEGLYLLHSEVLFVPDLRRPEYFHPRVMLGQSFRFRDLPEALRHKLEALHDDFFYHRHNRFWKESALRKLPTLVASTGMLCCGEDLGMVPACVPEVMDALKILSLEIQRMPKAIDCEFGHPARAPYLSVCTTGTHDMNPIRQWWAEDAGVTERFQHQMLGLGGAVSEKCPAENATAIVRQHLQSPAMWVILPWQDWIATEERLWRGDGQSERINVPVDTRNYWCYRMHLGLEQLLADESFSQHLSALVAECGR